jgi:hypothetical protein
MIAQRLLLFFVVAALLALGGSNMLFAELPVQRRLGMDERNSVVSLHAYHRWGLDPSVIVLDLWSIDPRRTSMADVDRVLFQSAEALSGREFRSVVLAYRGRAKFEIEGARFKEIGESYSWQNPVYLIRTLPEKLRLPSGEPAFSAWTGGWLGVVNAQMKDHEVFHNSWYLADAAGS